MKKRQYRLSASLALLLLAATGPVHAGVLDALDKLSGGSLGGAREFLDPELAFRFNHGVVDGQVIVNFEIEPGYYLYRDKMKLTTDDPALRIGALDLPAGAMKDDPEFGNVEIYRLAAALSAPVSLIAATAPTVNLNVDYQGCAEDAICYPPIKKTIEIAAAALTSPAVGASAPGPPVFEPVQLSADAIALEITDRSLVAVAGTFLGFGLLLAFTPCVFPMVPILSGIIVGQRQPVSVRRGMVLSGIYVLAVAATYAVVGLAAGLFGHNLQVLFQHPVAIVSFSLV
jgi:thiol:disulfide interchange protein DsbD